MYSSRLTSFIQHYVHQIHTRACVLEARSFLFVDCIPLCKYTTVYLLILLLMGILGCFYLLALSVVNTFAYVFYYIFIKHFSWISSAEGWFIRYMCGHF